MDAQPPQRPPVIAQLTPETKRRLDEMYKNKKYAPPKSSGSTNEALKVNNYGPIESMTLGSDWKIFDSRMEPPPKSRRTYSVNEHCEMRIYSKPRSHDKDTSAFLQQVTRTIGPVPNSDWNRIVGGDRRFFKIHSVEVVDLGGERTIIASGQYTGGDHSREKMVYVSPSGDWTSSYYVIFEGAADKATFEKEVAKFEKALKTVVWKKE